MKLLYICFAVLGLHLPTHLLAQHNNALPKAPLTLELISPKTTDIKQLEKVEIGFIVPNDLQARINSFLNNQPLRHQTSINPFLEWELNIEAVFTHKASGTKITRHGFYYQEMARDYRFNHWKKIDDSLPLRVRFATDKIGEWEVSLRLFVHGELSQQSHPLTFHVAAGENKGYVTMHPSKRYFQRDGEVVIPAGANLPYPYVANNKVWTQNPSERLNLETWHLFTEDIERYANEGGKHFRFFMSPSSSDIEFEELGNYSNRQHIAWEIDQLLELCEEKDLLINFNMLYHTPIMRMADYHMFAHDYADYWHDDKIWPYKDINPVYAYSKEFNSRMPSDMVLNPEAMNYVKQRIRYIMARWGHSTAIGTLEILSEPWHMNEDWYRHDSPYDSVGALGDASRKAAHLYHRTIANYIKDELGIKHYLIGAVGRFPRGEGAYFSNRQDPEINYNDSTWFEKNIDFISLSYYASQPDKLIISKRGKDNNACEDGENSYACGIQKLQAIYDKPVIFGESDHGDDSHACSALQGHKIDMMRLNLTGAAGHYLWGVFNYQPGNDKSVMDERTSWKYIAKMQAFYDQEFIRQTITESSTTGRQRARVRGIKTPLKEHHYVVNKNQLAAVGAIYNRTFNIATVIMGDSVVQDPNAKCQVVNKDFATPMTITWKPNKMKITGLKPKQSYLLTFYDYQHHDLTHAFEVRTNRKGSLDLVHPELGKDMHSNPLYWYVLKAL